MLNGLRLSIALEDQNVSQFLERLRTPRQRPVRRLRLGIGRLRPSRHIRGCLWQRWGDWRGRCGNWCALRVSGRLLKVAHSSKGAWRIAASSILQSVKQRGIAMSRLLDGIRPCGHRLKDAAIYRRTGVSPMMSDGPERNFRRPTRSIPSNYVSILRLQSAAPLHRPKADCKTVSATRH